MSDLARIDLLERAAIAEEVASVLRHDLRGKMGVVLNSVYYIRKKLAGTPALEADPRISTFFTLMEEEVGGVEKLLTERVGFKDHFSKNVGTVALRAAVDLAVARLRERVRSAPDVEVTEPASGESIQGDALEIALAVACLLQNAAEAAPGKPIRVVIAAEGGELWISVIDHGPGISADDHERALTALVSTKPGHLGVGLNVARRLVSRYGGGLRLLTGGEGFIARLAWRKST